MDMIIQEEELSNAEVTDEIQLPKLACKMPIEKRMLNRNVEQTIEALGNVSNQIKEGATQFLQV